MSDKTKAVNLTEREITILIQDHGNKLYNTDNRDDFIERINYLNRRLKTFKEPETETEKEPETETEKQNAKADAVTQGWGTGNG